MSDRRIFHYILYLFLGFITYHADGQIIGLDLIRNKKYIDVPFKMEQGFIIVKVWIENAVPLKMIFDTGAENTILFDKEIAQILGIKFDRQISITGSDLDSTIIANIARNTRMQLEKCFRTERDIIVLEDNNLLLQEKLGIEVNGIIGGSFFSNLVVKINYTKRRITLQNPNHFSINTSKYEEFDLRIVSNKPYVTAEVYNASGDLARVNLLLDTGASLPFLLHSNTDSTLQMPERVMVGNVGFGLSGAVKGYLGITKNLKLGPYEFKNIATSYQDILLDPDIPYRIIRNGILGNTLLSRFYVVINYPKQKMYLRAKKKYAEPFQFDKSGLTIFAVGRNLNQYYVVSVISGSPAHIAGIRAGDIIIKLNRRKTKNLKLQDITYKLSQKSGKNIKMTIKRDDEIFKTEFKLNEWFNSL